MKIKKFKNSLKIRKLKIGKLRLRTYIALGLIVLMLPIVFFTLYNPGQSEAGWFDMGYSFRKLVPVANSSGEKQTDFQVQITLDTQSLIADSKMQSDCDDLRVTDINGNLQPHWVEPNTCNTTETLVWVKVPTVHTSGTDLYVYYGNPSAAAAASGTDNVFIRDMESAVAAWPMQETDVNTSYAEAKHPGVDEGRDIVINGGFDTDTVWSKGTSWTITGGVAHSDGTGTNQALSQTIPLVIGKTYEVTFTISNYVSGRARVYLGTTAGAYRESNGTFTETITVASNTNFNLVAASTLEADIDNVSIKQVDIASSADFDGSELLTDGDMEAADTSAWTDYGAATGLSKETINPLQGARLLRILGDNDDTISGASQPDILTIGKTYHVTGYVRSDGTSLPSITTSGSASVFWTGTNSTDWQYFDEIFIADHDGITLRQSSASSVNYTEWDDVSVVEISPLSGSIPVAGDTNRPTVGMDSTGGHLSTAYTFDGTDDYVDIYSTDLNSVFNPDEGTLVAWAKVSDAGVWSDGNGHYITHLYSDGDNFIYLDKSTTDNTLVTVYKAGGTSKIISTTNLGDSIDWFQTVLTWSKNEDEVKMFINGTQVGTTLTELGAWTGNILSTRAVIGSHSTSTDDPWSGDINDVRLYDRALSSEEIANLYSATEDRQAYYTDNYEGHELIRKYNTGVSVGTFGDEEAGPGPVAYWKFDEGADNSCPGGEDVCDSTTNGYDIAFRGTEDADKPVWQTENHCIDGKCLLFEVANDYLDTSFGSGRNLSTDPITISIWAKPKSGTVSKIIYGANNGTNQRFYLGIDGDSNWSLGIQNSAWGDGVTPVDYNRWTHLELVTDGSSAVLYVNGKYSMEKNYTSYSLAANLYLANQSAGGGYYFEGFLDEVKIYPYARTEAQIKEDFNQGAAVLGLADQGNLSDGLVGYWTMDETSGTTVADKSGNGNNGTLTNAQETGTSDASGNTTTTLVDTDGASLSTTDDAYNGMILSITDDATCPLTADAERIISDYDGASKTFTISSALSASPDTCSYTILHQVGGKFGNGVEFDGVDDYVQSSSFDLGSINAFSTSAWIKLDSSVPSNGAGVIYKRNAVFDLQIDTIGRVALWITNDNAWHRAALSSAKTDWDTWHHLVATYNGNKVEIYRDGELIAESQGVEVGNIPSSIDSLWIGRTSAAVQYTSGSLDETRIYNRALSSSEVKQLYNWAPGPVGYWDFEEGTSGDSQTIIDKSGNGNNGITVDGANNSGMNCSVPGKYGKACQYDGVDDYSYVPDPANGAIDSNFTSLTISAWIKTSWSPPTSVPFIDKKVASSNNPGYNLLLTSDGYPQFKIANGNTQAAVNASSKIINDNNWHYVSGVFEQGSATNTLKIYIDGQLISSANTTIGNIESDQNLNFGTYNGNSNPDYFFPGLLDDVRIYNYARTPEQIRQDMMGSGQSTAAGADPLPQPVAHWSFDEMQGQTANDKVGGNNGTLGADGNAGTDDPTWTSSGKVNGALSFDGGDFVNAGQPSALDFTPQTDSFAINFWANINNDATGYMAPVSKATEGASTRQYSILFDPDGLDVYLDIGGVQTKLDNILSKGAWHHYSLVVPASSTGAQFYVDGILQGTANIGTATNVVDIHIGHQSTTADRYFDGLIDEVKIYNSALSAEQVRQDMNSGSALAFGGVNGASEADDLIDGAGAPPVAYWSMDEKQGSSVGDKSGNGNIGTITGASWKSAAECKVGACLSFDGSGDQVQKTSFSGLPITNITVSGWINIRTLKNYNTVINHEWIASTGSWKMFVGSNGTIYFGVWDGANQNLATYSGLTANTWYYVTGVYDGSNVKVYVNGIKGTDNSLTSQALDSVGNVEISYSASDTFDGLIDEVKIYNYVRTPAQIAYDYNRGAPIAHWKFNECEGSTIHDSSGNGNHGTLTVTTDGGNSAGVGTCNTGSSAWGSGADGKFGSSLNFDGDGDYASIPSSIANSLTASGSYSISAWFKVDSSSGIKTILNFYNSSDSSRHGILLSSSNTLIAGYYKSSYSGTTTPGIQPDTWYHVVLVNNEGVTTSYLNSTPDTDGTPCCLGTDSRIGYSTPNGDYFPGQIDDVQIYNYALSASQVKKLYNQNSAIRFGP